ncbi:hypothetical protein SEA_TWISTER6_55 [Gordonia phage Twister6]|uniref:Uncharacterized protein n=2 Tax=Wizardvirus TaxID=2169658 RepID=A0A5P8DCN2_9CAUD|nr:hypothetical protein BI083_gp55 [Gordonia phage Twister6]YP_010104269.1 hypothetical protein KNU74_gp55 [Gordonia phage Fireball]AOE44964.1 hypothetical protein SEA_TWISTER6_55 [Gordonia phage Twister6]QFP95880.1 hypothetical protein SEA_FIREBALL_55 [Gordonia phage Fireball]
MTDDNITHEDIDDHLDWVGAP